MEFITDFFQWIYDFFASDGPGFFEILEAKLFIWWMTIKVFMIQHAWDVASAVIQELQITSVINQYLGQLDSSIASFLVTLRVPDAVNLLIQAHITRAILGFIT